MRYETLRTYRKSRKIGYWPSEEELDAMSWKERANATRDCQYEVPYTDYTFVDGSLSHMSDGSEDFSVSRGHELTYKTLYGWYGKYNKGGHKVWEEITSIKVNRNVKPALIKMWAQETCLTYKALDIQVRAY